MDRKAIFSAAVMATTVALFAASGPVYASKADERIESSARKSYVFESYLKDDDIKVRSKDGAVIQGFGIRRVLIIAVPLAA